MGGPPAGSQLVGVALHEAEPGSPAVQPYARIARSESAPDAVEVRLHERHPHPRRVAGTHVGGATRQRRRSRPAAGPARDGTRPLRQAEGVEQFGDRARHAMRIGQVLLSIPGGRPVGLDEQVVVVGIVEPGRGTELGENAERGERDVSLAVRRNRPGRLTEHLERGAHYPIDGVGGEVPCGDPPAGRLADGVGNASRIERVSPVGPECVHHPGKAGTGEQVAFGGDLAAGEKLERRGLLHRKGGDLGEVECHLVRDGEALLGEHEGRAEHLAE